MARKRKGEKVDGWLVIDKPLGISSAKVVGTVKRVTNAQKVGHGGTLDPLASGILPIALGEATKTMPYIVDSTKEYAFTVGWGKATDSDDLEGAVIHDGGRVPDRAEILAVLPEFTGIIEQVPPAYSAIKVDGKRAYALARQGETVELKPRNIEIQSLSVTGHDAEKGETTFHVSCGKGTYVRSLGRDIALRLGTYGHITMLRRLRVGPFGLEGSISLALLSDLGHSARARAVILPLTTALDDIPAVAVTVPEADRIRCGQSLHLPDAKLGTIVLMDGDTPLAIAENIDGTVRSRRVFNM
ncbi:tRNA pseudouridine(55) synthase TruB [Kordiimonas marina]|uniref:tRNA pseudouridine(55) synthase TruB n=1 Tax=Kordiimonas marina TaxID=2872312 RepID=UPI001FF6B08B|nr:tRNA pseudouridine(55) synthase TruB [Kordiimonas marina]MCJ9428264.1 tRNA pseudouridine(55) synthase TruB [Kordiimonas marina]